MLRALYFMFAKNPAQAWRNHQRLCRAASNTKAT